MSNPKAESRQEFDDWIAAEHPECAEVVARFIDEPDPHPVELVEPSLPFAGVPRFVCPKADRWSVTR